MFPSGKVWLSLKPAPQAPQSVTAYPTLMEDSRVLGSGLDQVNVYSVNQYSGNQYSGNQFGVKLKLNLNDILNRLQLS